jgi:hypothetical protein
VESLDGNAIVSFLMMKRASLRPHEFGEILGSNRVFADHYAAFSKFLDFKEVRQFSVLQGVRMASMELLYGADRGLTFGRDGNNIQEVLKTRLTTTKKKDDADVWFQIANAHLDLIGLQARGGGDMREGVRMPPARCLRPPRLEMRDAMNSDKTKWDKIIKICNVNPRMVYWVQFETWLASRGIDRIKDLAMGSKKKDIPYRAFAEEMFQRDSAIALGFALKIPHLEDRLKVLQENQCWAEAAKVAKDMGNHALAQELEMRI